MTTKTTARGVESVARALDVLEHLGSGPRRLTDLARDAGLRPSTTHRLLATLVQSGHVRRVPTGEYALGFRMMRLAASAQAGVDDFQAAVAPFLGRVHRVSRRTANLFAIDSVSSVLLEQLADANASALNVTIGARLPSHATASGKVGLAFSDRRVVAKLLDKRELQPYTPRTIIDSEVLLEELDLVRQRGFATSNREYGAQTTGIAAPIFDETQGLVGALGISLIGIPEHLLTDAVLNELGELVGCAAIDASSELGYVGESRWHTTAA